MKTSLFLFLISVAAYAQTTFEIHGTVGEPGLGGIAGAEVSAAFERERTFQTTVTNARGEFVFRTTRPGAYQFSAARLGYLAGSYPPPVSVNETQPYAEVVIDLVRPGEATGRVLDADSREPVEGLQLIAVEKRFADRPGTIIEINSLRGAQILERQPIRPTDADGVFSHKVLPPGDYVAILRTKEPERMTAGFTPDDLHGKDYDFVLAFADSPPLHLPSGGNISFGNILVTKTPRYRIHVTLPQGDCPEGESVRLALYKRGRAPARIPDANALPCGSEVLVRGVEPGSYMLYAVSDWQGQRDNVDNVVWGMTPLEVVEDNLEVSIALERGVVLEGRWIAPPEYSGSVPNFVTSQPAEILDGVRPIAEQFIEPGEGGKFRIAVSPRSQTLMVRGAGAYVKEIRYNGVPLPDITIPVNPGTPSQQVELVLDDKLGALTVTVADQGEVLAILYTSDGRVGHEPTPMGGTFRFTELVPGDYFVTALRRNSSGIVEISTVAPPDAQRVTIRAGETLAINVRVTGASR